MRPWAGFHFGLSLVLGLSLARARRPDGATQRAWGVVTLFPPHPTLSVTDPELLPEGDSG